MSTRQRRVRTVSMAVVTALAMLLTACAAGTSPESTPAASAEGSTAATPGQSMAANGEATVTIDGLAFGQDEISVAAGTTVTWDNRDSMGHTVTHGQDGVAAEEAAFDMAVAPGESVSFTFDEPGEYRITCTIHPQMNMTVVVQ